MLLNNFYTIQAIAATDTSVAATIVLNKEHAIFQGHFPGSPVVPGVCLMTIVKELLENALGQALVLQEAKQVKFLGVIDPNIDSQLAVKCSIEKQADNTLKTNSTFHAGERVCYKAVAVYR